MSGFKSTRSGPLESLIQVEEQGIKGWRRRQLLTHEMPMATKYSNRNLFELSRMRSSCVYFGDTFVCWLLSSLPSRCFSLLLHKFLLRLAMILAPSTMNITTTHVLPADNVVDCCPHCLWPSSSSPVGEYDLTKLMILVDFYESEYGAQFFFVRFKRESCDPFFVTHEGFISSWPAAVH